MRRFLYFLPGLTGCSPQKLAAVGLIDRFATAGGKFLEHQIGFSETGPAGAGMLIAAGAQPPEFTEAQRWIKGLGKDGSELWAGLEDPSLPPRAEDLERELGISGYILTLADGSQWRAPLIRRWDRSKNQHVPNVPTYIAPIVEGGKRTFVRAVDPKYAHADQIAEELFSAFNAETTMSAETLYTTATELLAINYRIGLEEAGLLGLFDGDAALDVLKAAIDEPTLREVAAEWAFTGIQAAGPIPAEAQ